VLFINNKGNCHLVSFNFYIPPLQIVFSLFFRLYVQSSRVRKDMGGAKMLRDESCSGVTVEIEIINRSLKSRYELRD
jgi:hypothetical protein